MSSRILDGSTATAIIIPNGRAFPPFCSLAPTLAAENCAAPEKPSCSLPEKPLSSAAPLTNTTEPPAITGTFSGFISWFHFNGAAASGFIRFLNGDSIQAFDWDASRDCFEELERLAASPTRKTDLQLSLWVHTLLNDLAAGAAPPSTDPDAERITEAAAYLRENCAQSLTIEEIARKCNLSKFHFIRVFRRFTGWTPYEYLTLARISEAKSLLTSTSLGLSEIAARTGYADAKSLIRVFRQHTGMTPAGYRKQFPVYENSRHDSLFGKPG